MSKKKSDKKIIIFQPAFHDILACRDPKKRPNIEIFISEPENIYQESLGRIAGVFEIIDDSEDSSYVVNYLISVIKKEYFSRPKRGAVESFEAALHKANLTLSKLASHGSVNWIGHINAVCMVIEKNNLHISQTGTACVLLLRSNTLTNISEGGEILESNPLKTFQDVLSGRMENNDKIILATDSIFEIFSLEEIKKSALKFSKPEFIQFLKTALINEMERAAVLVVDITKKEEVEMSTIRKISSINAFSQTAFQKAAYERDIEKKQEEKKEIIEEIKEEFKKTQDGFVDEKTGHIYIKDPDTTYESNYSKLEYISTSKDKFLNAGSGFMLAAKKSFRNILDKIRLKLASKQKESKITVENEIGTEISPVSRKEKMIGKFISIREKISPAIFQIGYFFKKCFFSIKNALVYKIIIPVYASVKKLITFLIFKYKSRKIKIPVQKEVTHPKNQTIYQSREDFWKERTSYLEEQTSSGFSSFAKMILPSFSKIKNIIANLSFLQKIYATLIILAIIIIPYFIVKYDKKPEKEEAAAPVEEIPQSAILPLSKDVNVVKIENLESAYQGEGIVSVASINGKNFAVGREKIVSLSDQKEYPLSDEFKNADLVSQMDDLNFIFIMKNKKIVSFSATAGKFQDNNISVPDGANIISARSYLTYLYLLDIKNNQIYRYPRAEGGFGEKTNWLKDSQNLSEAKDMTINDNIYITDGKQIFKFFQGKKQGYSMEQTATPIAPDKIYTKPTGENLYVLDKENSRVVKLDKDGKITAQYYNSEIGNTDSFAVDEEKNTVFISNEAGISSFEMKNQ